ncbi:MAG: TIGR01777 family oxidoreductase [Dehalococcoidia bacterium]
MTRIAITGSSGLIGTALQAHLTRAGHEVIRVRRGNDSDPSAMWNPDTGWFREGGLEGVEAVIHLAGAGIADKRWNESRKAELLESRVKGTRLLVDHLATLTKKPAVLLSSSAVGFYGSRGDEQLTEASAAGEGFLPEICVAWEQEAMRASELGIRTVAVRTGVVLTKRGGALAKMLPPFKMGMGGRLGDGKAYFPWISLEDIVGVYEHLLAADVRGPVNAVGPNPVTNGEFTKALGKAIHRPTLLPVPTLGLKVLYGTGITEETLLSSQRVLPGVLEESGYDFQQATVAEALEAALA